MIIAEVGSVHDGSLGNAKNLIFEAKRCGADYAKMQMHIAEEETTKKALSPSYFKNEKRYDYFKRTSFKDRDWKNIIKYCKKIKIKFLCSVFSIKSAKKLIKLGVKNIKIPSGEVTNLPLLNFLSKKDVKIFLSTGMSDYDEITQAISILKRNELILMQCTSIYPCPPEKVGLNLIIDFKKKFSNNIEIGFSDHTKGQEAGIIATVYGAKYIEKHITFSNKMYGSDARLAMELNDFKSFCKSIKITKKIINSRVDKNYLKPFLKIKKIFEKKIVAKKNLFKGNIINISNLAFKKSNSGINVKYYNKLIGKKVIRFIGKDEPINLNLLK